MKKTIGTLILVALISQLFLGTFQPGLAKESNGGMPGWPVPENPIPHHEVGQRSKGADYSTQVMEVNADGVEQEVTLTGLDALLADGAITDPLQGNYSLVNLDKIMMSWHWDNLTHMQTFTRTLSTIPGSQRELGNYPSNDIAAGDLNGDGQAEQIAAWIDPGDNHAYMSIGEMPGSIGRTTSSPAAVAHDDGSIDLLVRGYDQALWHRHYNGTSWEPWNNKAGGLLLTGPAIASQNDGTFDAFALGLDSLVYQRHWDGSAWSSGWQLVDDAAYWVSSLSEMPTGFVPMPGDTPPPAAVSRDGGFDLFRLASDNTLRWRHFDGSAWGSWINLHGMLASAPAAVSLGSDHVQVFARGVDEALWHRTYKDGWGPWKRLELNGMDEGVTIGSTPTAVSPASGKIEVYVRGSDHQLWQTTYDGSGWGSWSSPGGQLASGVAVAAENIFAQAQDGSLQHSTNGADWTAWGGLIPCCVTYDTSLEGQLNNNSPYKDYSLDVETGYFLGDTRSQIVLAYLSSSNRVTVALYEILGGFLPQLVDQVELPHDIDYFSITTGDFLDGDGIDEVAIAYVNALSYGVDIVRLSRAGSSVAIQGATETESTKCWNGSNSMRFAGTLEVVSGDFDADGLDEIAMSVLFDCEDFDYLFDCHTYRYHARTRLYDVADSSELRTYSLADDNDKWVGEAQRVSGEWSVGLTIASGDVDGDGQGELIRTWPVGFGNENFCPDFNLVNNKAPDNDHFSRELQVIKLPDEDWPDGGGQIENATFYKMGSTAETDNSYIDRLAAGDLDRDISEEVAWVFGISGPEELRTYDYVDSKLVLQYQQGLPTLYYPNLVTGDFTGESLRVGRPTYRRQYGVGQVIAIINAPPKHQDTLDGATYNLNANDDDTNAHFVQVSSNSTEVSVSTHKDWGVDASFSTTIGDPDATHTTASLESSYGQDFDETEGYQKTITFSEDTGAVSDDVLYYTRLDYDVWEYPVLTNSNQDPDQTAHLTVVFPVNQLQRTVQEANTCDTWYSPGHQLMNVLSYPSNEAQLLDYDASRAMYPDFTNYFVGSSPHNFSVDFQEIETEERSNSFDLGFAASFEQQIGGEEVTVNLQVVEFSTRLPSVTFSTRGEYNYSELSTWTVETTSETNLYGNYAAIPDAGTQGYSYFVRPYLYWSQAGYLVMDYVTSASSEQKFWSNYDQPDPAFILPYQDGRCDHISPDQAWYTNDITIDPPFADSGENVSLSATVRNFSNVQAYDVTVDFYRGDPQVGGEYIDSASIDFLGPRAVESTDPIHWQAAGTGDQHIYAVIDPSDAIDEIHDQNDAYVNNNKGFGVLHMAGVDYVDMGLAVEQPYYAISYTQGDSQPTISLYVPPENLSETPRFELRNSDIAGLSVIGLPFDLLAFTGKKDEGGWDNPVLDFSLQPEAGDPPAVLTIAYGDAVNASLNAVGLDETDLELYRLDGTDWEIATCEGYRVVRFLSDDLIAVPICQTGTFALSDKVPEYLDTLEAAFSANPVSGPPGLAVQFKDLSSGYPTSWKWDFGDNTTSSAQNPTHIYTKAGTYTVTLTVSNYFDSDTLVDPALIHVYDPGLYMPLIRK